MPRTASIACASVVLALLAPATLAQTWGGLLAAGSDHVYRGQSNNQGAPAAQLDLHLRSSEGWFGGAWLSTANRLPGYLGSYELNLYGGRSWALAEPWGLVARFVRYAYPKASVGSRYDYDEASLTLVYDDRVSALIAWSPDHAVFGAGGQVLRRRSTAAELSLQQPLAGPLWLAAGIGHYDTRRLYGSAYSAWHLGLVARWGPLELHATRFGTDRRAGRLFGPDSADGRWVLTAARRF